MRFPQQLGFLFTFLFYSLAAPILTKRLDPVFVVDGKPTEVSCTLDKANPLPTFTWEYQNQNCRDADVCPPVESKWAVVPGNLMLTPTNTPTNRSVVEVKKDQPAAYYRCNASNTVGIDSHIVTLVRLGKKFSIVCINEIQCTVYISTVHTS